MMEYIYVCILITLLTSPEIEVDGEEVLQYLSLVYYYDFNITQSNYDTYSVQRYLSNHYTTIKFLAHSYR